jgi:hypothetical protein
VKPLQVAVLVVGVIVLWFALSMTAHSQESEFFFQVKREDTFDFKGIQFFHLRSADGTATLSVDGDVRLSEALKALDGQRVRLTLENATLVLKRIDR